LGKVLSSSSSDLHLITRRNAAFLPVMEIYYVSVLVMLVRVCYSSLFVAES
jgi:hypothetical protein